MPAEDHGEFEPGGNDARLLLGLIALLRRLNPHAHDDPEGDD